MRLFLILTGSDIVLCSFYLPCYENYLVNWFVAILQNEGVSSQEYQSKQIVLWFHCLPGTAQINRLTDARVGLSSLCLSQGLDC